MAKDGTVIPLHGQTKPPQDTPERYLNQVLGHIAQVRQLLPAADDMQQARYAQGLAALQAADEALMLTWGDPWELPAGDLQTCLGQLRQILAAWDGAEPPEEPEEVYEAWALQREAWEDRIDDALDALDELEE